MQTARRTKALALALALAFPAQARAQAPLFIPLVPPAGVVLAPLTLMLLIPLDMELSKTDEKRVRELEARGDWAGVVALATRNLAAAPGDLYWLELRGRALQRQSARGRKTPHTRPETPDCYDNCSCRVNGFFATKLLHAPGTNIFYTCDPDKPLFPGIFSAQWFIRTTLNVV